MSQCFLFVVDGVSIGNIASRHVAAKACAKNAILVKCGLSGFKHINSLPKSEHVGRSLIRTSLDQFKLAHFQAHVGFAIHRSRATTIELVPMPVQCLVRKPMSTTLKAFRKMLPGEKLLEALLRPAVMHVLFALDYLHSEAKVIHTGSSHFLFPASYSHYDVFVISARVLYFSDVQENHVLLNLDDTCALEAFKEGKQTSPIARKVAGDRIVNLSRKVASTNYGQPVLCDFQRSTLWTRDIHGCHPAVPISCPGGYP